MVDTVLRAYIFDRGVVRLRTRGDKQNGGGRVYMPEKKSEIRRAGPGFPCASRPLDEAEILLHN
jgi:hypothetical protein